MCGSVEQEENQKKEKGGGKREERSVIINVLLIIYAIGSREKNPETLQNCKKEQQLWEVERLYLWNVILKMQINSLRFKNCNLHIHTKIYCKFV